MAEELKAMTLEGRVSAMLNVLKVINGRMEEVNITFGEESGKYINVNMFSFNKQSVQQALVSITGQAAHYNAKVNSGGVSMQSMRYVCSMVIEMR
jgi:hypothetical protein